ncbi:MAG: BlaI/MecI/CopY family transcriptional regulator [Luteitalea sp.]|nr:BlaI/MecI/CopY family transcriptional regulator [Luteitalea sp.]
MRMSYSLTELQLALMRVLWERSEATVVDVQEALEPERRLAQSTVATLLSRLEKKGLLSHRVEGRQYVYRPRVSEADVKRSMVGEFAELADELFQGDVAALVSHLLTAQDVAAGDLARVKALIEARERELSGRRS